MNNTNNVEASASNMFVDTMDSNRLVQPFKEEGDKVCCKVYWRGSKGSLAYGGNTKLSQRLFSDNKLFNGVGFRPATAAPAPTGTEVK